MTLRIKTSKAPNSFFKPGVLGMKTTFAITVFVNQDKACTIEVIDAEGSISASLSKGVLTSKILSLYINDARVVDSNIGDQIPIFTLRIFANWAMNIAIPVINEYFGQGLSLPTVYFGFIQIEDAIFRPLDGFLQVGIVPHFL